MNPSFHSWFGRIIENTQHDISEFWRGLQWPDGEKRIGLAKSLGKILLLFTGLYIAGLFVPDGFDYVHYFSKGIYPSFWIPWSIPLINHMNNAGLFAVTILALVLRTRRYKGSGVILAMVLLSLPTAWEIILGNVDGLVLLGLLMLPWGAPLALFKPQIAAFALLARKSSLVAGGITIAISLLIWGLWPLTLLHVGTPAWRADWPQDITLYPWGLILAIPLMWLSRGDEDLLMAAGSLGTPHLFPYHFIVLMPAMGRMRWYWAALTWVVSWLPLTANWLGPVGWHFGNLLSLCFWFGIYTNRKA